MPNIIAQIVLQANPGHSASPDDWRAVVGAICNAVRARIANAKENAYTETIPKRKESTEIQPSAQDDSGALHPRTPKSKAVSGKEPTA